MRRLANIKITVKELVFTFAIGFVLFLLGWYAVIGGQISSVETVIFRLFNNLPQSVVSVFVVVTYLGSIFALLAITAVLVAIKKHYWAIQVFLAGFLAWAGASAIKVAQIRERPYDLLPNVHLAEAKDLTAGFPSAHTALITAAVLVLFANETRKIYWLLVLAVVLVGISRMVVGVHAPIDIVGGMGIGLMAGSVIKLIFLNNTNKKPRSN
jgi:membrane-associated phospholipid phosphatase